MFGSIGFAEIALIAGIALIVLGPEKFPEFAKVAMRGVRDIRKYMSEAQQEISKELNPLKDELDDIARMNPESYLEDIMKEEEEYDDDSPLNPEPHPDDIDWMSDPYNDAGMEESEDNSGDSTSSEENSGGDGAESTPTNEPVEYNLYGAETEGADPSGVYGNDPEQADEFNLAGGYTAGEETEPAEDEKPLDG